MLCCFNKKSQKPLSIEFFVWNTYDVPHMAPIAKELLKQGMHVTCFVKKPFTLFKNPALKKELLDYYHKVIETLEATGLKAQTKRNYNANVVLISQMSHKVRRYKHMKVKIGYGASPQIKDCHHRADNIEGFDAFLVHGQFEVDSFSQKFARDRLKIMGAPKFDAFFQNPPNKDAIKQKLGIHTDKKIILYLPTWDKDRSIPDFEEAITVLKSDYFILCKPHNNTYRYSYNIPDQEKLQRMSSLLFKSEIAFSELVFIADLLLTDIKSGATTEAIYLTQGQKPWIGLTALDFSEYYPAVLKAGPVLNDPKQLRPTIDQISQHDTYTNARISLSNYCYGSPSGPTHSAKDAVQAIIELSHMQPQTTHYPYFLKKMQLSWTKRCHSLKALINQWL